MKYNGISAPLVALPRAWRCWLTVALGNLLAFGGCSSSVQEAANIEASNLRAVSICYSQYQSSHAGRPPADLDRFKKYIFDQAPGILKSRGATVDELLISERDGEPFVVFTQATPAPDGSDLIAYEQQGVNGKRLVARAAGAVEEVDEQDFQRMLGH